MISEMKARQSCKIKQLGDALITAGFLTLDEQANALGLCRSTTWTVIKGNHKASGLSSSIINRMLMSPQLPQRARTKIVEYVQEKASGLHGHNQRQLRNFTGRLIRRPEIAFRLPF
jgi:predicted DNA-binding transcriptional regulator AlpA